MSLDSADRARLRRLRALVDAAGTTGVARFDDRDLADLPRLYRHACTVVARLESTGEDPRGLELSRRLVIAAHMLLFRDLGRPQRSFLSRLLRFFFVESPRAIRAEWKLLACSMALLYGLAAAAFAGVQKDLDLAYSLLDRRVVEAEIRQLQETPDGEPFRGNFTFGLGESPAAAGMIMLHNMGIGILFFAASLIPPLYVLLLCVNALMLGTYTAVAGHWGQAGELSTILWCHGTLEIQALVLAGTAGLVLVRAWIAPGPWTRSHALQLEAKRAWRILGAVFPLLFVAGLIEGFLSPHAPEAYRVATAVLSGLALVAWIAFSGLHGSTAREAVA